MSMNRLTFLMLVAILLAGSSVYATIESETFDGMTTADLDIAPWDVMTATPTITTPGLGGNSSKVMQLELNDQEVLHPTAAAAVDTVAFDLYLEEVEGSKTIQDVLLTDTGWLMAYLRFSWGWGGDADGVDLTLHQYGNSPVVDVMAFNEWTRIILDYDATVLGAETFDVTVISPTYGTTLAYDDQLFWEYNYGHNFSGGPSDIRWYAAGGASGPRNLIDNVNAPTIVPEPMTIALLGLGGLFLRRIKA